MLGDSPLNNVKLLGHLFESINTFYKKNKNASSTALRGINLTAKLRNSNTELFGHIDYAFIDDTGKLHIYNFKPQYYCLNFNKKIHSIFAAAV